MTFNTKKTGFLSINHQSQFPAATIFFNLQPGVSLGQAVDRNQQTAMAEIGAPNTLVGSFQGNAQAFQSSLNIHAAPDHRGACRDLHHSRHAV